MSTNEQKPMTREERIAKWGQGPWVDEPDHVEFRHNGVPCIIHRNSGGVWCGYAAVEPGHPWHGMNYSDRVPLTREIVERENGERSPNYMGIFLHAAREDDGTVALDVAVNVHGGLTYSDKCQGAVCHVAQPGEPDNVWWLGFDCGHCDDLTPSSAKFGREHGWRETGVYRDAAYVRRECEHLADQVIAARVQAQ